MLADYVAFLAEKKYKASYLRTIFTAIKAFVGKKYYHLFLDPTFIAAKKAHSKVSPTLPRLLPSARIWDVQQVLDYLRDMPHYTLLPDILLAKKTVMLILLATGRRKIDVLRLKLSSMIKNPEKYSFLLTEPSKNYSSTYNDCQLFDIHRFPQDCRICPYIALTFYIRRTKQSRRTNSLFIVSNGDGTPASSTTLARWVRLVMQSAGIDTTIFKAHSTRAAAMSAAYNHYIPLGEILASAKWKISSTFYKYYCRQVEHFHRKNVSDTLDKLKTTHLRRMSTSVTHKYHVRRHVRRRPLAETDPPDESSLPSQVLPLTVHNLAKFNQVTSTPDSPPPTELYSHGSPPLPSVYQESVSNVETNKMADAETCGEGSKGLQPPSGVREVEFVKPLPPPPKSFLHRSLLLDEVPNPLATKNDYRVVTREFNKLVFGSKTDQVSFQESQFNKHGISVTYRNQQQVPLLHQEKDNVHRVQLPSPAANSHSSVVRILNQPPARSPVSVQQQQPVTDPALSQNTAEPIPVISAEDIHRWTDLARYTIQKSKVRDIPPVFMDFRLLKVVKMGKLLAGCVPVNFHQIVPLTKRGFIVTCLAPNNVLTLVMGPDKFKEVAQARFDFTRLCIQNKDLVNLVPFL